MGLSAIPLSEAQVAEEGADEREEKDVHEVYESIAPHFSSTRYKAWPIVERFLTDQLPFSLGLDSGAGNGKYLSTIRKASDGTSWMIGLDRSSGLLALAREQDPQGEECVRADLCFEGWRAGLFDFAISIAAIHHLSTASRRQLSVSRLLSCLSHASQAPHSRFLIYVWAFEQGSGSKRKMGIRAVDDGESGGGQQDVMVPWILHATAPGTKSKKPEGNAADEGQETKGDQVFYRYYHLFKEGELEELVHRASESEGYSLISADATEASVRVGKGQKWLRIVDHGYEKDNWWVQGEVGLGRDESERARIGGGRDKSRTLHGSLVDAAMR